MTDAQTGIVPDVDGSEVGDPDYDVDQSDAPCELVEDD